MASRTVTPGASVAPDRETNSHFLPSDPNYRLTGELPDELEPAGSQVADDGEHIPALIREERAKEKPVNREGSAPSSETAAASEAASTQQRETETQTRTAGESESRWRKLSRENRELREKLARQEGRAEGAAQRDTSQASQPAADTTAQPAKAVEPKIDDVDPKTGKPKFATFDEYLAAVRKYDRDQVLAEIDSRGAKSEQQRAQTEAEKVIEQTINERVAKIRETHPDYDDSIKDLLSRKDEAGRDEFFYTKGSHIDGFFLDSDVGHEVMLHLAQNWDAYKHIFARDQAGKYLVNPIRQVRELAKIEHALGGSSSNEGGADETGAAARKPIAAKPVSQAPRPPHQTSGKGAVTKDPIAEAVEAGDTDSYMREMNARDLARRKRGK